MQQLVAEIVGGVRHSNAYLKTGGRRNEGTFSMRYVDCKCFIIPRQDGGRGPELFGLQLSTECRYRYFAIIYAADNRNSPGILFICPGRLPIGLQRSIRSRS